MQVGFGMQHSTTVGTGPELRLVCSKASGCSTSQPLVRGQSNGLQQARVRGVAQHNRWHGARAKLCGKGSGCSTAQRMVRHQSNSLQQGFGVQHSTTVCTALGQKFAARVRGAAQYNRWHGARAKACSETWGFSTTQPLRQSNGLQQGFGLQQCGRREKAAGKPWRSAAHSTKACRHERKAKLWSSFCDVRCLLRTEASPPCKLWCPGSAR